MAASAKLANTNWREQKVVELHLKVFLWSLPVEQFQMVCGLSSKIYKPVSSLSSKKKFKSGSSPLFKTTGTYNNVSTQGWV